MPLDRKPLTLLPIVNSYPCDYITSIRTKLQRKKDRKIDTSPDRYRFPHEGGTGLIVTLDIITILLNHSTLYTKSLLPLELVGLPLEPNPSPLVLYSLEPGTAR